MNTLGTDDQNIDSLTLTGTVLTAYIENGGNATIDLSALVNDADSDPTNEYNTGANLTGTDLNIIDGGGTLTVDMTPLLDSAYSKDEWKDADSIGMSGFIFANQAMLNGDTVVVTDNGSVGIGMTTPAFNLDVDSTINTGGHYNQFGTTILTTRPNASALSLNNTAVGRFSLTSNTTGNNNTANGTYALYSNTTGHHNTANGENTLQSNDVGHNNTANGVNALQSNDVGHNNTANGVNALQSNMSGNYNTATGIYTLFSNKTGNYNTANGASALRLNITGRNNTANGAYALYSNTTGNYNTASGRSSLYSNTTGNSNTANGRDALRFNTTGNYNTANGVNALRLNTTGNYNTANGLNALYSNTTGNSNTANGTNALRFNTTGNSNTANGYAALYYRNNSLNTAIGYSSFNSFVPDPATVVNFTTPGSITPLDADSTSIYIPAHGYAQGVNILVQVTSTGTVYNGQANGMTINVISYHPDTLHIFDTIFSNGTGTLSFAQYDYTPANAITNSTALGYNAEPTKSNQVMLGDVNVTEVKTYGSFVSGTTTYADYVFEDYYEGASTINANYKFKSLAEVEEYILKEKHLPGVKSIADITDKDGKMNLNLTESAVVNLEKIEELYLHLIQVNKEKEELKEALESEQENNEQQQEQIDKQQEQIDWLIKELEKRK